MGLAKGGPAERVSLPKFVLIRSEIIYRERKISPKFFRPKFFRGRPRGMSVPKCLFFFFPGFGGPDRSCPQGRPAENFGLWADFSFLNFGADRVLVNLLTQNAVKDRCNPGKV